MSGPGTDLANLGREVARAQDEALESAGHIDHARRLLSDAPGPARPRIGARIALATTALAAIGLVLLWRPWSDPSKIRLSDGREVPVGAWISAPGVRPLVLRFSDGSKVVLEPASSSRVLEADEDGARVVLERGVARVSVAHRKGKRWTLAVGPYEILVTGTRFRVAWDPQAERFTLSLHRGVVRVTGPLLTEGRMLAPGQTLVASGRERRIEITATQQRAAAPARVAQPQDPGLPVVTLRVEPHAPAAPEPERPGSGSGARVPTPRPPSWRELSRLGSYREALAAAEQAGFETECVRSGAADLHVLGDTARFAGSPSRAAQAFEKLRGRFPRTPQAAAAAFALGRIAFDSRHSYGEATRWFETYLVEAPRGPLAREASGRLIEAQRRSGDAGGARAAARRYLDLYPDGPHADLARSLSDG